MGCFEEDFSWVTSAACSQRPRLSLSPHAVGRHPTRRRPRTTATTSNWTTSTTFGWPAPFIQFVSPAGTTTVGEILVTAPGTKFRFLSVDLYSSTTPIPYVITGVASSTTVLSIQATQGNTFGNFATVVSPQPATPLDALIIRLTNPSAPCCSNPMGLDNIVVAF